MKCECGCKKGYEEEVYPFICPKCNDFNDCDVVLNGYCICHSCEKDLYEKLKDLQKENNKNI